MVPFIRAVISLLSLNQGSWSSFWISEKLSYSFSKSHTDSISMGIINVLFLVDGNSNLRFFPVVLGDEVICIEGLQEVYLLESLRKIYISLSSYLAEALIDFLSLRVWFILAFNLSILSFSATSLWSIKWLFLFWTLLITLMFWCSKLTGTEIWWGLPCSYPLIDRTFVVYRAVCTLGWFITLNLARSSFSKFEYSTRCWNPFSGRRVTLSRLANKFGVW